MGLIILILLIALLLGAAGFALHFLWVLAVVLAIFWVAGWAFSGGRPKAGGAGTAGDAVPAARGARLARGFWFDAGRGRSLSDDRRTSGREDRWPTPRQTSSSC